MEQGGGRVSGCRKQLVVGGQTAGFVVVEQGVDDTGPVLKRGQSGSTALFVKGQLEDAGGGGPHRNHVLTLGRLILEVSEVVLHGLHGVKGQHVGPVVGGHVDKQWSHFVGEMVVNSVVSLRRRCFGREIVEIGLKRGW